ncbi:MAG: CTP synthase [bacterium]
MNKIKTNFIFITGGVLSSLGKGVITVSLASLIEELNYKVNIIKLDPYLNVDAGTMNPYEHGEVFITFDGGETDLDIGHYERFTNILFSKDNNITAGRIYMDLINKEREGLFLGKTIQVVPHLTNEIKEKILKLSDGFDFSLVEVGGTVGDIEGLPFLEAIRQMYIEYKNKVKFIHITYVPFLKHTEELKTKPSQHSIKKLQEAGIQPHFIIVRSEIPITQEIRNKIALFSNLLSKYVINIPHLSNVYQIPLILLNQNITNFILNNKKDNDIKKSKWIELNVIIKKIKRQQNSITIGIVGKYTNLKDSYKSLIEALKHSSISNSVKINIKLIDSTKHEKKVIKKELNYINGFIVAGGFGIRGVSGKINILNYLRENKIPTLGICLGLQLMVVEFFQNVLNIKNATSQEFILNKNINDYILVVKLMEDQKYIKLVGGTMRLGNYKCKIIDNTLAFKIYQQNEIIERHRHRYEINNKYLDLLKEKGFIVSGINKEINVVEIMEYVEHPFYLGVQFHPEFNSRVFKPNKLFSFFINFLKNNR